jgi:thiol-disulfide isomerase/thioredoxin
VALAAAGAVGFTLYGLFQRRAASPELSRAGLDIRVISKGEPVNLRDELVPGKYTLFDYYADWCPPCRELAPALEEMVRRNPNVALRKIDIVDWKHPVAAQQGVDGLPFFRLYGPDGRLIREGEDTLEDLERLFHLSLPVAPR